MGIHYIYCVITQIINWYQTFNHKYGLTYVFPCFKDIISNAEDDATSPFRVVSANVASFKPLDLGINLISHLLISGNGEVVLYDSNNLPSTQWHNHEIYNNGAYKKYNVKTGKISDLEQCNGVSGITEDGKTIFGHTRLTPEGGDPIAALWENGQEKRTLLPCLSNVYGISQDKTILGRPQTEEQSNNLVLCKNREITERIALSFKGCNLLPDGKTILGYDNKTEAVIWHNRKISKMPKGFTWPFVRSKGQRIIGVRDDHLAEYIDEYKIVRALPIYVDTAQVINDGLIAYDHPYPGYVEPSTRIWKDGSCYPVFQLLKK